MVREEDSFEIDCQFFNTALVPGQRVTGEVYLWLAKPTRAKCVAVLFQGLEKIFNGITGPGKKTYASKQFFSHKVAVWEPENKQVGGTLDKGEHSWNFSFQLPENLPPSMFFDDWLFVFFQARSYVEPVDPKKAQAKMISETIFFDVIGTNENRWLRILAESVPAKLSEKFHQDQIRINAFTQRNNWNMGETVVVTVKISNETSKALEIKLDLFQLLKLSAPSIKKEFPEIKLSSQSFRSERLEKDLTDQMRVLELFVPENDDELGLIPALGCPIFPSSPPSLFSYFSVVHYLRIKLKMGGNNSIVVNLPISVWDKKN